LLHYFEQAIRQHVQISSDKLSLNGLQEMLKDLSELLYEEKPRLEHLEFP
jgi:hypothetical protein